MWNTISANIFSELIKKFKEKGIRYFILRNYEGLPEFNNSKDVDIIIEPGSYEKAFRLLYEILEHFEISHCHVVRYERVRCWYGIDYIKNFSIHIDLIEGYLSKGFEMFSFELLYQNTEEYNDFTVLYKPFDAIMLLYYKIIGAQGLKDIYVNKISSVYKTEKSLIDEILKETLGSRCSFIVSEALQNENYPKIIENAAAISKASKKIAFFHRPMSTIYNVCLFLIEKFYRIVWCPRKYQNFIAVEGADGTGKSTFIDGLNQAIIHYYVADETKCHIYHFRPTFLPNLGAVAEKANIKEQDKDFTNPHRAKPVGFFYSLIRMSYYWLDYLIGVPALLRKDVQFDKFTIYDRYIYDFLIDPKRARINLPYWLRKIFTKLVVQPRIVFVLLTDAETIYKRKQELTIKEINRQLGEFLKLAKSDKRFVVIDASLPPQEMVNQAIKVIIDRFTTKLN
ncbi:MAG: Thymidylate kinase [Candidatus Ordinivivax streblomastigis]|uniref:Thymidylate kinase n=1 Tax=Candidatus Ordinivivax streblomastigis TaxID=2540710 RepID=A0A5M8P5Z3_9BACT|nr:MAG: Thymidylate kinase [Candidatus Ordinivivax streblomastigis]